MPIVTEGVTEGNEIRCWVDFAMYHAAAGQRDESIKWLRKAVESGWRDSALVSTDEDLGTLGGHPEFEPLRRKLEQGPAVAPELADLLRELQAGAV